MPVTRESYTSRTQAIAADVFSPLGHGRHPACLVLHGAFGLLPDYQADLFAFGHALAEAGIVGILPHYFDRTGTPAGLTASAVVDQCLPEWIATCADGLAFAAQHRRVNAGQLATVGFSLGGHIAMTLAMAPPSGTMLRCVVDFFGPTRSPKLCGSRSSMPPIQIHHGRVDTVVDVAESEHLVTELRAAGKVEGLGYEFLQYRHQGHGFTGADLVASRAASVAFVHASL